MAFDGIVTYGIVTELKNKILLGKIEKIYQPTSDELVFNIHTRQGNLKVYASCNSSHARINFIDSSILNPPNPLAFCMLLRKHLQGGRIIDISQRGSERIIEISFETFNELGFNVSKKLIFEIMGKHSNIILIDMSNGKIIDSIKRISIDINRVRQILPGMIYEYPPMQEKIPFKEISEDQLNSINNNGKILLNRVSGISPAVADELALKINKYAYLSESINSIENNNLKSQVYLDEKDVPKEFHILKLTEFENSCKKIEFETLSEAICFYFDNKKSSNRAMQKSHDLVKSVSSALDKVLLKKQRLCEDILKAENSENLRLYGELLTSNIHLITPGQPFVDLNNYYDNSIITIPLNITYSPAKNAQLYYKKYGKSKTAIKEKQIQLEDTEKDIQYLESVLTFIENTENENDIEDIRNELVETGYTKKRKSSIKQKKFKAEPLKYNLADGITVLVGKNNKENDVLTLKTATKQDMWLHTKDIPGSHVIVQNFGEELSEEIIYQAAAIAAYHSNARTSENVPVDYVKIKYVKKPAGAKPGMVIFTNNKTVWVNPKLPNDRL